LSHLGGLPLLGFLGSGVIFSVLGLAKTGGAENLSSRLLNSSAASSSATLENSSRASSNSFLLV